MRSGVKFLIAFEYKKALMIISCKDKDRNSINKKNRKRRNLTLFWNYVAHFV